MPTRAPLALLPLLLAAAACDRSAPAPAPAPEASAATTAEAPAPVAPTIDRAPADGTAAMLVTDAWLGRWTGPEGLFVDIAPGGERGRYAIVIKGDLDTAGDRVDGIAEGDTIRFERNGVAETLRAGNGADTGLKWLADKTNCLVVKSGEGFCRN